MRRFVYLVTASSLIFLGACGSGSHSAPMNPVFTSTPPTAAAQDVLYSYTPAATDPSGGSVTFSLTSAPTGATLTGGALNWTPSASQSRASNSLTIQATTSSGAAQRNPGP